MNWCIKAYLCPVFSAMSSKDGPYARNLIDALVKTFVMFIGEIDELSFADLSNYTIRNPKQNIVYLNDTNVTYNLTFGSDVEVDWDIVPDSIKVQIVLGQLVHCFRTEAFSEHPVKSSERHVLNIFQFLAPL